MYNQIYFWVNETVRFAKMFGVIIFIAIIGFSFTSCSDGDGEWGAEPPTGGDSPSSGSTLPAQLLGIYTNAESNSEHTIELTGNGKIGAQSLSFSGRSNITIRLTSSGGEKIISLSDNGSLFTIGSSVNLIIDNGVTLLGHNENNAPLIRVQSGGTLIMKAGSKISGNTRRNYSGGGIVVDAGGIFLMEGGEVSGNGLGYGTGAGVYVDDGAEFQMSGGKISGNTTASGYGGGGVYVANGRFIMIGGEISSNKASIGGGVEVESGNFTMEGGKIFGNTANTNSTSSGGGGVYVSKTIFTMNGGEIAFNTAPSGGGVFVASNAGIAKTGGIIYGYTIGDSNRNTATSGISSNNRGHAVFVNSSPGKRRETTAGPELNLDSDITGAFGGWE